VSLSRGFAAVILSTMAAGCIKRATIEFANNTFSVVTIRTADNQACRALGGGRCRIGFHPLLLVVTGDISRAYELPPIGGELRERATWEVSEGFMDRVVRLRLDADHRLTLLPAGAPIATDTPHQPPGYPVLASMSAAASGQ
jgi:hypothetical protein